VAPAIMFARLQAQVVPAPSPPIPGPAPSLFTYTLVFATLMTIAISLTAITTKSKASVRNSITAPYFVYLFFLEVGNAASSAASIRLFSDKVATIAPVARDSPVGSAVYGLFFAIVGVFGFSFVFSRINLTLAGKGILKLDDWTVKARARAEGAAGEKQDNRDRSEREELITCLRQIPDNDLHTRAERLLDRKTLTAASGSKDPKLYLATELAEKHRKDAAAICREFRRMG
jgi:hypothetical protein